MLPFSLYRSRSVISSSSFPSAPTKLIESNLPPFPHACYGVVCAPNLNACCPPRTGLRATHDGPGIDRIISAHSYGSQSVACHACHACHTYIPPLVVFSLLFFLLALIDAEDERLVIPSSLSGVVTVPVSRAQLRRLQPAIASETVLSPSRADCLGRFELLLPVLHAHQFILSGRPSLTLSTARVHQSTNHPVTASAISSKSIRSAYDPNNLCPGGQRRSSRGTGRSPLPQWTIPRARSSMFTRTSGVIDSSSPSPTLH